MKNMLTCCITALALLASAGSLAAHHALSQFDTTTAVRVKGAIVRVELINPHSILFVDQRGEAAQIQRWAVEGPGILQLKRMGFDKDTFKVGDVIEACGYVLKDGDKSQRTVVTEPISLSLKPTTPKSVSGRPLDAEMLVMPDGQKRAWSDYGFHKCLGPNYQDHHTR
jgi:Family of unknown function (DUF6152)